jgi:outer membrane protein assembly factor BamB
MESYILLRVRKFLPLPGVSVDLTNNGMGVRKAAAFCEESAIAGYYSASIRLGAVTMKAKIQLIAGIVLLTVACAFAADWPQYYGPQRDSTSTEKGLLRTWPKEGPRVLWTVPVGIGYGGPVVSGGKVYLLDRDDVVGDKLRCLDFSSGKELWSFAYDAPGKADHPGSRSAPTADGNFVYTCGQQGELYCINTTTQKPVWNKNIWKDFGGGSLPRWVITQNPLIYRNLLIVASQTPQAGVVAYDKLTGELKWKSAALTGVAGYVSPSIVKVGGEDHLVMISGAAGRGANASGGSVNGLDPLSGKALWTYGNWQCIIPVPHAVDAGEGRMLITGGYRAGAAMIKVQKKADGSYEVAELFKNPDFGAHTQPPILYKGNFYAQYTINELSDGLVCMGMDGQVKWKTGENPLFNKGGMILVDDLLLSLDGNKMLYLIQPDPSGFKPLSSAEMLEPGENWAPLALVDGKLLIRDQKNLKCLTVAK